MHSRIAPTEYSIIKKAVLLYHQNLATNPGRVEQLERVYRITPETVKQYQIGFCDGSNRGAFPENPDILQALEKALFIDSKGAEYFREYFTFPVYAEGGGLAEIVGLPITGENSKKKTLKLTNLNSFLNWQCFKMHKEVLLTYNIPLFFEAVQKGIRNVVPLLTNFISEHQVEVLREAKLQKICLAFLCNDKSLLRRLSKCGVPMFHESIRSLENIGQNEIDRIISEASPINFTARHIQPVNPDAKKDTVVQSPEVQTVSEEQTEQPKETKDLKAVKIDNGFEFRFPERTYRVLGVKLDFVAVLKVLVKVKQGEYLFFDSLDLYSLRSRTMFIKEMVQKLNLGEEARESVEKELVQIIEEIETEREKAMRAGGKQTEYVLSAEEKAEGLGLLCSPDIFDQIDQDMTRLGYVGERINKIITYLVATSRKMDSPLASIIVSRSAAGKSKLVETVEIFMPPEDVVSMTASTDQAFYYMTDGMMKHKLVTISEQEGKHTADYPIRELLSRKYLSKALPLKDKNGNTKTIFIKAEGPISYIETTTNFDIHPENASRCFQMYIDESEEQTGNVQVFQKQAKTKDFFLSKSGMAEVVRKHQSAQRLLKPILIFNPFVQYIRACPSVS